MKKWFALAIGVSIPVVIVSCGAGTNNSSFSGGGGSGEDTTSTSGGGTLSTTTTMSGSLDVTTGTGAGAGTGTTSTGTGNTSTGAGGAGQGGAGTTSSTVAATSGGTTSAASTGSGGPCASSPNSDIDMDGYTPAQGDCNDCDPNVNPGAIDVGPQPNGDGGMTMATDNDCDGTINIDVTCDTGLALTDVVAIDGAKSIELCQQQSGQKWGVTSANYVRANGTTVAPGDQVGIQANWGPNVPVQMGKNMLAISSGRGRILNQANACGSESCKGFGNGTAPAGFPATVQNCPPAQDIHDDVGLQVAIKSPTNATGYSFSFDFYSFEYPEWVCNNYNDQFIALVSPAPMGAINGNISFDSMNNPVSVNIAFFDVCDPAAKSHFAEECFGTCPSPPNPYCPAGTAQLQGNGFGTWGDYGAAGATGWLKTTAPIKGGTDVTIRFAIWDTGDTNYDSTALIDDFKWIASAGSVVVQTGHM